MIFPAVLFYCFSSFAFLSISSPLYAFLLPLNFNNHYLVSLFFASICCLNSFQHIKEPCAALNDNKWTPIFFFFFHFCTLTWVNAIIILSTNKLENEQNNNSFTILGKTRQDNFCSIKLFWSANGAIAMNSKFCFRILCFTYFLFIFFLLSILMLCFVPLFLCHVSINGTCLTRNWKLSSRIFSFLSFYSILPLLGHLINCVSLFQSISDDYVIFCICQIGNLILSLV